MTEIERREEAVDSLLPAIRLEGLPSRPLLRATERWSEAVWLAAERAGPYPIDPGTVARGLRLCRRPVFICGVHRSGTTLMRDLLDGHPALGVLPSEGSFHTELGPRLARMPRTERLGAFGREWLRRLANPINQAPYWLLGRSASTASPYVLFARRLAAWWWVLDDRLGTDVTLAPQMALALAFARHVDRSEIDDAVQRWVEKTPTNEFYLDRLRTELPRAKVIHMVRDPIAVYASRKRVEEQCRGTFTAQRRVLSELTRSLRIAAEWEARDDRDDHLVVRYETLVDRPRTVMKRVAAFLDVAMADSLVRPTVVGRPSRANSSFPQRAAPGRVTVAERAPDEGLSDRERQLVSACTGEAARALGYTPRPVRTSRKIMLKTKLILWPH